MSNENDMDPILEVHEISLREFIEAWRILDMLSSSLSESALEAERLFEPVPPEIQAGVLMILRAVSTLRLRERASKSHRPK